jgi:hypothetical protein
MGIPGSGLQSTGNRKLDIAVGLIGAILWMMKIISTGKKKD